MDLAGILACNCPANNDGLFAIMQRNEVIVFLFVTAFCYRGE